MQMEQSLVGKVLSSLAIMPPMLAVSSTRKTLVPYLAAFNAQLMPATPAPIIMIASAIKSPRQTAHGTRCTVHEKTFSLLVLSSCRTPCTVCLAPCTGPLYLRNDHCL